MSPKFLVTTFTVAPLAAAQSPATFVTAAARSESVQITMFTALCAAVAVVATTAASAASKPSSAHMRLSEFCIKSPSMLGDTRRGASWGQAPRHQCSPGPDDCPGIPPSRIAHSSMHGFQGLRYARARGGDEDDRAEDSG